MIAPRSKLKPIRVVQPKYIDLASSGAQLRRALVADQYPRLAQLLPVLGDGEALLQFGQDHYARPLVEATVSFDCAIECQLCLEPQPRQVNVQFLTLLAVDEAQAQRWAELAVHPHDSQYESMPAVAVVGETLDVAALVEDEVLLQLPGNVCVDPVCERRPALNYAPESADQADGTKQQVGQGSGSATGATADAKESSEVF